MKKFYERNCVESLIKIQKFVEIVSTFPSLDIQNIRQKTSKTNKKKKSVKISLKQNEPIYLTNELNSHLKMQFRHGKHLHVNFYHFIMENLFCDEKYERETSASFSITFLLFSMHEATVVGGIEFWREF
jgi:hypothetical protein